MIDPDRRKAIYQLHLAGRPIRELSRLFRLSRNTVRAIIANQGVLPNTVREDKIVIDPELLRRLYQECDGWIQRVHEKLQEEHGIHVGYSTLTRLLRELGVSQPPSARCERVPDEPGREMQHDTTVYQLRLAGQADTGHRQPVVPAVLQAAVSEVLPVVQPLHDEMFSARGVAVVGLRGPSVHHRQHESGAAAGHGLPGGDRPGNGHLRPAVRL